MKKPANSKTGKKPKKVKLLVPLVSVITFAVVLTCFLYSWNLFQSSGNPLFVKAGEVELPDFSGMQYEEALKILKQDEFKNLRVQPITEEYNPNFAQGVIISQNPSSSNDNKKMVKANQKIFFVVSGGVKDVTIPDLSGMSRNEAVKAILELGLRPYARTTRDSNVPAGIVVNSDPAAGAVVQNTPGTIVTIYVSIRVDKLEFTVPQLIGLESQDAARGVLQGLGVSLGVVKEEYSDAPAGEVINQNPEAGSVRMISDSVNITISKGPEPPPEPPAPETTTVPNFVGMTRGSADGVASGARVSLAEGGHEYNPAPAGTIIGQSVGEGGVIEVWGTVTLTISLGPAPAPPSSSQAPPPSSSSEQPPASSVAPTG